MDLKHIDKIFVINLEKDIEKLAYFKQQLNGYKFEIFNAIKGSEIKDEEELLKKYKMLPHKKSNVTACFLSHLKLWIKIVNEDLNRVLIFEDDINTHYGIKHVFDEVVKYYDSIEEEPDMFYLGKCADNCSNMINIKDNIYQLKSPLCTHAYILTKSGAEKMLSLIDYDNICDIFIASQVEKSNIKAHGFHPSYIFQDNIKFNTNLRGKEDSLSTYNECRNTNFDLKTCLNIFIIIIVLILVLIILYYIQ